MPKNGRQTKFVVCIKNRGYTASLELRKIYRAIADPDAEAHDMIRVVDESGEDYLYPAKNFVPLEVSRDVERALASAS